MNLEVMDTAKAPDNRPQANLGARIEQNHQPNQLIPCADEAYRQEGVFGHLVAPGTWQHYSTSLPAMLDGNAFWKSPIKTIMTNDD